MSPHPVICTYVPELAVVWLRSPCTAPGYVVTLLALLSRFPPLCLLEIPSVLSPWSSVILLRKFFLIIYF